MYKSSHSFNRPAGRPVPARNQNIQQLVLKEPVGPAAAFTPRNFPIDQANRLEAIEAYLNIKLVTQAAL